jgi:hypothetical protein
LAFFSKNDFNFSEFKLSTDFSLSFFSSSSHFESQASQLLAVLFSLEFSQEVSLESLQEASLQELVLDSSHSDSLFSQVHA